MNRSSRSALLPLGLLLLIATACTPPEPKNYAQFREHVPTSILVLPPTNQSVEVNASYSVMSSITRPLATAGYYVYPVAVVDTYFKGNGLPSAADMHNVPLDKLGEVFGADAVLYLDIKQYGQEYNVIASTAKVDMDARLVDVDTGLTLWEGSGAAVQSSNDGDGGLIELLVTAAVAQAVGTTADASHGLAAQANQQMVVGRDGFLLGRYNEGQAADPRGRVAPPQGVTSPADSAANVTPQ